MEFKRQAETALPTKWGIFRMLAYGMSEQAQPHLAMVSGDLSSEEPVLVRVHSECMTGDVFGSSRCDCGEQLDEALRKVAQEGGVVLYLRQEGRGIGLINKMKAYNLQDEGLNTADANVHLGFDVDSRDYSIAINILLDLGIRSIRLMTNNPEKVHAFDNSPIEVSDRVPVLIPPKKENIHYLQTKQEVMGHYLELKNLKSQNSEEVPASVSKESSSEE